MLQLDSKSSYVVLHRFIEILWEAGNDDLGGLLGGMCLSIDGIRRFGALPNGDANVILRTDNALVYASELYRALAKSYGLQQEFILPHTPEQNGVAESFMGT